jgi:hypothetical protein
MAPAYSTRIFRGMGQTMPFPPTSRKQIKPYYGLTPFAPRFKSQCGPIKQIKLAISIMIEMSALVSINITALANERFLESHRIKTGVTTNATNTT